MTCSAIFAPDLRSRGYRVTRQRLAILHVLHHSSRHLSPAEIYSRVRLNHASLTEPTVYRTLEFLTKTGLVNPTQMRQGHWVYELARANHHHLICRSCGGELEVEHTQLQRLYQKIETFSGYQLMGSHVTFFGICPRCQKAS